MTKYFRMKCPSCDNWNRVLVNKVFIEQHSPIDPNKVEVLIPMYEPLEVSKCEKCGKVIIHRKKENVQAKNLNPSLPSFPCRFP